MKHELYEVLGVEPNATPAELRSAYRTLSKSRHPDVEGGSEEEFKKLNDAYTVLKDPEARAFYDTTGMTMDVGVDKLHAAMIKAVKGCLESHLEKCFASNMTLKQYNLLARMKESIREGLEEAFQVQEIIATQIDELEAMLKDVIIGDESASVFLKEVSESLEERKAMLLASVNAIRVVEAVKVEMAKYTSATEMMKAKAWTDASVWSQSNSTNGWKF